MFAGRQSRLRLSLAYVDELVASCHIDEVHIWNYTKSRDDVEFVEGLSSREAYQVFYPEWRYGAAKPAMYKYVEAYDFYRHEAGNSSQRRWKPMWPGANAENTVLVKLDDDIVFLDVVRFPCFVSYVRNHTEMFLTSGNVVNHPVADYYRTQYTPGFVEEFPSLAVYPKALMDLEGQGGFTAWGSAWLNGTAALELHRQFTQDPRRFAEAAHSDFVEEHASCLVFKPPLLDAELGPFGQGRLQINLVGLRWAVWDEVSDMIRVVPADSDYLVDETALTQFATVFPNHQECIYIPFLAAHLGYHEQVPEVDSALPFYEKMLEDLQSDGFKRSVRPSSCF